MKSENLQINRNKPFTVASIFRLIWITPRYIMVGLMLLYRAVISPLYGPVCRFYPSCSSYAVDAYRLHGVVKGTFLVVRRLLRCNPWNSGGVDYVPGMKAVLGDSCNAHSPHSDHEHGEAVHHMMKKVG